MNAGDGVTEENIEEIVRTQIVFEPSAPTGSLMRYVWFDREKYFTWVPQCLILQCLMNITAPEPKSCLIRDSLNDILTQGIADINKLPFPLINVNTGGLVTEAEVLEFFPDATICYDT